MRFVFLDFIFPFTRTSTLGGEECSTGHKSYFLQVPTWLVYEVALALEFSLTFMIYIRIVVRIPGSRDLD
jgi:hypothetical protein